MTNQIDYTTAPLPADFLEGFHFECSCGERFRTVGAASRCRKCRVYTVFSYCTHVVDTRTEEVVWGKQPSVEEYEAAARQYETYLEMDRRDREREEFEWRAARAAEKAAAEVAAAELAEDMLWDIQEALSAA